MKDSLTARQAEMLGAVGDFIDRNGYSPSVRELGVLTGLSVGGVENMINTLINKGRLSRVDGQRRTLRLVFDERPKGRAANTHSQK